MVLEQRVGRVHRIGSTQTIIVETLLLRGSREAEVLQRITQRLQDIVRDLSSDPDEREALFRRILASVDPDALREILSGDQELDAVGSAVDAGRAAVNEADKYMQDLAAPTDERLGRASMARLVSFLKEADPQFQQTGSVPYVVLTEAEGGELRQVEYEARRYHLSDGGEDVIFDRSAAAYLGLRRDQTGGLGNVQVDPLIRAAIDLSDEAKSRSSSWIAVSAGTLGDVIPGDVVYFAVEAAPPLGDLANPKLSAWRYRGDTWTKLDEDIIEHMLWHDQLAVSRKAGEIDSPESFARGPREGLIDTDLHFPVAAIGIRERGDRR